jgi:acetyl esterase/lipase/predicted NBD/HSP70 family sugar kinase
MTRVVAALDLGGTHVTAGRVDLETAAIEARDRIDLPPEASRGELLDLIVTALGRVVEGVERVGVAAPGPFDYGGGISWLEHKLRPLCGVDLRTSLAEGVGLQPASICFVNDAEAFLVGEWWAGRATGYARVVGVTLGTGLGSAFLENGEPVRSGRLVPPDGALYLLDHRGAPVEETISRRALIARYGLPDVDVEEIARRARTGDERARKAFVDLAGALGEVLAPWLRSFEASCLVVGGSIARSWDLIVSSLTQPLQNLDRLEIIAPAARADDAALLGAARDTTRPAAVPRQVEEVLDPQIALVRRELISAGMRPLHELTVAEARAAQASYAPALDVDTYELEVVDLAAPVPIRLFRPVSSGTLPVCLWVPGGGWVLDTHAVSAPVCRRIAAETPCAVASIHYRLAPEHAFPAALEDCVAAARWIAADGAQHGLDPGRVAIGGTSAGANLAAAVVLRARELDDVSFAAQILIYPALLHGAETRSMQEEGDWVFLDRHAVEWLWSHYLGDPGEGSSPLASPLRADDLRGLPRALILTAEFDPLRDEGELFGARLRLAGVPTTSRRFHGVPHGFFSLAGSVQVVDAAQHAVISALRQVFDPQGSASSAQIG